MKDFNQLTSTIEQVHNHLQAKAASAINQALTIRNWLIGLYIVEFEQAGEDRAKYGAGLLNAIASQTKIKGLSAPELSRCRQFYQCYPQILGTLSQNFSNQIPEAVLKTLSQKSQKPSDQFKNSEKVGTVSPQSQEQLQVPSDKIMCFWRKPIVFRHGMWSGGYLRFCSSIYLVIAAAEIEPMDSQ